MLQHTEVRHAPWSHAEGYLMFMPFLVKGGPGEERGTGHALCVVDSKGLHKKNSDTATGHP